MKNASNAGGQQTEGSVVKSTVESTFQSGITIQELIRSGNVEAVKGKLENSFPAWYIR